MISPRLVVSLSLFVRVLFVLSICLSLSISQSAFVYISVFLSLSLSVCVWSFGTSIFVCLWHLSMLSVYVSLFLSVCLYVPVFSLCLSAFLYVSRYVSSRTAPVCLRICLSLSLSICRARSIWFCLRCSISLCICRARSLWFRLRCFGMFLGFTLLYIFARFLRVNVDVRMTICMSGCTCSIPCLSCDCKDSCRLRFFSFKSRCRGHDSAV